MTERDVLMWAVQATAGGTAYWSTKRYGDISLAGPALGVVSQCFWLVTIWNPGREVLWGLLPLACLLMSRHIQNLYKWRHMKGGTHGQAA